MTIGSLWVGNPKTLGGNMPCFASWRHRNGYWRWALYWFSDERGLNFYRARSVTGAYFPHFGCSLVTPLGTLRLATQPPWPRAAVDPRRVE